VMARVLCICQRCGVEFSVQPSKLGKGRGKYCSQACHYQRHMIALNCKECGIEFSVYPWMVKEGRQFCGRRCHGQWMSKYRRNEGHPGWRGGLVARKCEQCGSDFQALPANVAIGRGRFCGYECSRKWYSGPKSPSWRGGTAYEPYPHTFNQAFRRMIRARDNCICAVCGKPSSKQVHHINYVKADTTPENCITLCRSCHAKTNFNREYWIAFFTELAAAYDGRAGLAEVAA
jgi:hypothetical protein